MRAAMVRRFAGALLVALLLGSVVFERLARPTTAQQAAAEARSVAADGRVLFDQYCAACHTVEELRTPLPQLTPAQREAMLKFLESHGDAAAHEDRIITEYVWR